MRTLILACRCAGEIDGVVKLGELVDRLARQPDVRAVLELNCLCLEQDLDRAVEALRESDADSVLVLACSPLARGEQVLRRLAREGGPGTRLELVDLREGCAWIHGRDSASANRKASNLAAMGLAALGHGRASAPSASELPPEVVVVGAGPAGLAAAQALAGLGVRTTLLDRSPRPGGLLKVVNVLFPEQRPSEELLRPLVEAVEADPLARFMPNATVKGVSGGPGQYRVEVEASGQKSTLAAGAVILACGGEPVLPGTEYRYKELKTVISQMELEARLGRGGVQAGDAVFIQCVQARTAERPYCSSICCPTAVKNGLRLAEAGCRVTVLHRDVMALGDKLETHYRRAMDAGVRFVRFDPSDPPRVVGGEQVDSVAVRDALSGAQRTIKADLVVLSTPVAVSGSAGELCRGLGVRTDELGFACGREPMSPLSPGLPGVFVCGSMRWPVSAEQAVAQGRAAGVKAAAFLAQGSLPAPAQGTAVVLESDCSGCGRCVAACPFGALRLEGGEGSARSRVDESRCQGCGLCGAVCPNGAVRLSGRPVQALRAMAAQAV